MGKGNSVILYKGNSTLMSARTINSKGSGGMIRFPSIADDEASGYGYTGSPRRPTNEPYNSFDPIGKRGTGKQEPIEQMRRTFDVGQTSGDNFVKGISIQSVTQMGFDYKPETSMNRTAKLSDLFIKRKVSNLPAHELRKRNKTRLDEVPGDTNSNRFFDTFTKF